MNSLEALVSWAKAQGASDLHLEAGMAPVIRVRGTLIHSEESISSNDLMVLAKNLLSDEDWCHFLEQKSSDLSLTISGVRCRINLLKTSRGIGVAVRLLTTFKATLEKLNLNPVLREILTQEHGLVLVSGPTGCGKSSTLAALVGEINSSFARHIITIENPIEYHFKSQKSLVRQREVGRDTPSFSQALIDSLREDPDVIVVGEMRDVETMRLTLNAAETGHLVFATVHSSNVSEAIQRVVSAFPAEIQDSVRSQLADSLVAVVSQRLRYRPDLKIRIPECEIMFANTPARIAIREGKYPRLKDIMQTGASENMWTFSRYASWIDAKQNWYVPSEKDVYEDGADSAPRSQRIETPKPKETFSRQSVTAGNVTRTSSKKVPSSTNTGGTDDVLIIHDEDDLDHIARQLR